VGISLQVARNCTQSHATRIKPNQWYKGHNGTQFYHFWKERVSSTKVTVKRRLLKRYMK